MSEEHKKKKRHSRKSFNCPPVPTAILIDGGFYMRRYPSVYEDGKNHDAAKIVRNLIKMAFSHARRHNGDLYRIFYYDCKPFADKIYCPITNKTIDFGKTDVAIKRNEIFSLLVKERKVAIRYGQIKIGNKWSIRPRVIKQLFNGKVQFQDLTEDDIYFDLSQKGVDMKIGLDVASLAYKKLVKRIVLVSGDSDFVPAAKLARREGIDFILDPLWSNIHEDLYEHIDGLQSTIPNPNERKNGNGRRE